jgi:predicted transglutaminase-like cysteine proteinase
MPAVRRLPPVVAGCRAIGTRAAGARAGRVRATVRITGALALSLAVGAHGAYDGGLHRFQANVGPHAAAALQQLRPLLAALRGEQPLRQLQAINAFFNARIRFATDDEVWGRADHWASPLEVLERGVGDCEDYAIAKYFTLRALGVPASSLRLVYVRARLVDGRSQPHMVLAWYAAPESDPLLLDNLVAAIEPASQRADLTPVFSFNDQGLWQGLGRVEAGVPAARLPHWREVSQRARAEGFL